MLFRLSRLGALSGQPLIRYCEGRFGISRREWRLIAILGRGGPCNSGELAERARLDSGPTSKAITLLSEKSLIFRKTVPNDRRQVVLELTAAGQDIYSELYPIVEALNESLLSPLSAQERAQLDSIMDKLEDRLTNWMDELDLPKADRRHRTGGAV